MKGVTEPIELACSACGRSERFSSYGEANAKAGWIICQDGSVLCGPCRWARQHGLQRLESAEEGVPDEPQRAPVSSRSG